MGKNSVKFAKLNKVNYTSWSFCARHYLMSRSLWSRINPAGPLGKASEDGDSEDKDEYAAKMALIESVEESQLCYFTEGRSAREWWKTLQDIYMGKSNATLNRLLRESATIEKFANTVDEKYSQLMNMNERIGVIDPDARWKEVHLIALLLGSMPPEYETVVDLINDKAKPEITEVVSLLRKKEEQLTKKSEGHALAVRSGINIICNHCGKRGHMWRRCKTYLATEEGKKFLRENP
jgi:gag-polypeptide of LTR copia-type